MKLWINGTEESVDNDNLNISELLKVKKVKMPEMVSVELNDEFLNRENFDKINIKEGDKIEFLYFMGGGEDKVRG